MEGYIISSSDSSLDAFLAKIIENSFNVYLSMSQKVVEESIKPHLTQLKENIKIVIETGYVDKVYRDSYYTYYASKQNSDIKNCIKLSFFEYEGDDFSFDSFANKEKVEELRKVYKGFIILRPTLPYVIGRSAISPTALKEEGIKTCVSYISSTVLGVKFQVRAFPFSSQDTETMSCAETMIWALMEYYGNRYPEYSPILPSRIHNVLKNNTSQRQLPSSGLPIDNMSYMLKECGFGPKLYSREEFKDTFDSLLSCYTESGIPVIIALENSDAVEKKKVDKFIGHAVLCVGREEISSDMIEAMPEEQCEVTYELVKNKPEQRIVHISDWHHIEKKFVFIDDNCPAYQLETLSEPTTRYSDFEWKECKVSHFIVPLYKKIYLEAYVVKHFIREFLLSDYFRLKDGKSFSIRTFLCSTRSYRQYAMFSDMNDKLKGLIRGKDMPKFIWVTEISDKKDLKDNKASGLIVLDATEANKYNFKPLIFSLFNGKVIEYDKEKGCLSQYDETQYPFTIYNENLKKV